jgi:glutathione synthase/RimK-type ligase-like ATP-grasp enzyme
VTFVGVYREKVFSPGKVMEDSAILDATLQELSRMGHRFYTVEAEKLEDAFIDSPVILTMAQSARALKILDVQQKRGARILNSVASVRNSYRRPLIRLLQDAGLPIPRSKVVATGEVETSVLSRGADSYWLKRGDVHAMEAGDVKRIESPEELTAALSHFKERKIGEVLVQEHIAGDVVKFYGASRSSYFSAFLESTGEEITSEAEELRRLAGRAAEAVGLEIYGGDAVFTAKRDVRLIDVNDWPSFSRCRDAAAKNIAGYIAGIL